MSVGGTTRWAIRLHTIATGKTPIGTAAAKNQPRAPNPNAITPVRQRLYRLNHRLNARGVRRLEPHQGQQNGSPNRISAHLSRFEQFGQSSPPGFLAAMTFVSAQEGSDYESDDRLNRSGGARQGRTTNHNIPSAAGGVQLLTSNEHPICGFASLSCRGCRLHGDQFVTAGCATSIEAGFLWRMDPDKCR
jgi:hypothetical protein